VPTKVLRHIQIFLSMLFPEKIPLDLIHIGRRRIMTAEFSRVENGLKLVLQSHIHKSNNAAPSEWKIPDATITRSSVRSGFHLQNSRHAGNAMATEEEPDKKKMLVSHGPLVQVPTYCCVGECKLAVGVRALQFEWLYRCCWRLVKQLKFLRVEVIPTHVRQLRYYQRHTKLEEECCCIKIAVATLVSRSSKSTTV